MYVYFIQCDNKDGYIKIGKSNDPWKRLLQMITGCPYKLKLLQTVEFKCEKKALKAERQLHKWFKHGSVQGEWHQKSIYEKALKKCQKLAERS